MALRSPMCPADGVDDAPARSIASLTFVSIGSVVSIISLCNNLLIFYCLFRSPRRFQCYFQFLLVLSAFDIIVSACYVPVIATDTLKDWLPSVFLARLFWSYFTYVLTITHISMTAASFVLVGAMFERYLITVRSFYLKTFQAKRTAYCIAAVLLSIAAKGGIVFELDVFPSKDENCKGTVSEFYVDVTPLTTDSFWYGNIYRFWMRNFVTVFLPFFLLVLINVSTVVELKNVHKGFERKPSRFQMKTEAKELAPKSKTKGKVRSATWTLILVAISYLLTNFLNVIVTAWEFLDIDGLMNEYYDMYMFSTDVVSLLVVAACALRLPIYLLSNPELRRVIFKVMKRDFSESIRRKTMKSVYKPGTLSLL